MTPTEERLVNEFLEVIRPVVRRIARDPSEAQRPDIDSWAIVRTFAALEDYRAGVGPLRRAEAQTMATRVTPEAEDTR